MVDFFKYMFGVICSISTNPRDQLKRAEGLVSGPSELSSSSVVKQINKYLGVYSNIDKLTIDDVCKRTFQYLLRLIDPNLIPELDKLVRSFGPFSSKNIFDLSPQDVSKFGDGFALIMNSWLKFTEIDLDPSEFFEEEDQKGETEPDEAKTIQRLLLCVLGWKTISMFLKLKKNETSDIWRDAYAIGLLQGRLGVSQSIVDPELIVAHHAVKSGEGPRNFWQKIREKDAPKEKPIVEEIERITEDKWGVKKETIRHDEMKEYIFDLLHPKYPEFTTEYLRALILRTLRPIAKKYNRLRGVPIPKYSGTVERVDLRKKSLVVNTSEGKITFSVKDSTQITKHGSKISLSDLKVGLNVFIKYIKETMTPTTIEVTTYLRQLRKKKRENLS